jgi:5'-nucleotidase/UDP-sugar diphosphatase
MTRVTMKPRAVAAALAIAALAVLLSGAAAPQADGILRLHLMWTNDLHGHIVPEGAKFMNPQFPPPLGGAASAARYIKQVREEAAAAGEAVLLMDVGDMFQGTPIGTKTAGTAVIEYFNAIGYDFAVPGNHDFDLGRENTERLARMSDFPWLCANLVEETSGEVVSWCRPTLMLERGGVKIGVIGIITPGTERMSFPANIAGLKFLPMPETIEKYRPELKAAGADLICLAIHEGLPYDPEESWKKITETQDDDSAQPVGTYGGYARYGGLNLMELVNLVPGIDFAVGGHTHRGYPEPWIDPVHHTLCFETFGNGSSLGHAILKIDRSTRALIGYEAPHDRGTIVTLFEDEIWPDQEIAGVLEPWAQKTDAEMGKVIGQSAATLTRGDAGSGLAGYLVTDAMREYFDADMAFQNLGGIRADISAGDITARDVFSVLPFGNQLVIVGMPGSLLRRIVERKLTGESGGIYLSGAEVVYDGTRPEGDKVVSFEVGGQPLDNERLYRVVLTNFLMEGNSGLDFLTSVDEKDVELTQITTAEAVERYIKKHTPLRLKVDGRWVERKGASQAPYLAAPYIP